jgi:hypothetical protein
MRSAARDILRLAPQWTDAVYGVAWQQSPWSWSDATPAAGALDPVRVRARIQIDQDTATVVDGALAIAEEFHLRTAEFSITRTGWLEPDLVAAHETVLIASARAVTAIGGDRRRGLGWVSITPTDPVWPTDDEQAAVHVANLLAALAALPDLPKEPR